MPKTKVISIMRGEYVKLGLLLLFLLMAAIIVGEVFRGEMSPWVWVQVPIEAAKGGTWDAVLLAAFYLVFYLTGFIVPYLSVSVASYIWLENKPKSDKAVVDPIGIRASKFMLSFGCMILFVLLLGACPRNPRDSGNK
jgi:hypothetical protein